MVRSWWSPPASAKEVSGARQTALGGARLDLDETGDFLVRVSFDVVQNENFAEAGWQALEDPSDVPDRVGISRSDRVVEFHMLVPVGPPPPLAITVQGDPRQPRPELGIATEGREARGRPDPCLLEKVGSLSVARTHEPRQQPVGRGRVAPVEAEKRAFVALDESPDQNRVGWLSLLGHGVFYSVAFGARIVPQV
jgi:hypothetical protein